MKHASLWGDINEWFGTLEELSFGSAWSSAHIESMSNLCSQFLALHGKLTNKISYFGIKVSSVTGTGKNNYYSWKSTKSRHWMMLDQQKRVASSWYALGRTNDNADSWSGLFWSNSNFWNFKVVYKTQHFLSCSSSVADYVFKQINIHIQGPPKIKNHVWSNLSSPVQRSQLYWALYM